MTSFSFRAFRFATRSPGGRGSLYRRADEGIRPYGRTMAFRVPVGADALIGPLQKPHRPSAATAQPLAALPLTDAAYPLRVKRNARKEEPVEHW